MTKKTNIWNKEKIAQVIVLYKKHECLWNHYKEDYKSKECRTAAIEDICRNLRITKFEFGKKIHNLRNQFNSEMKKLERRMEESGCTLSELSATSRCRWEHFDSLMFLRDVIEPRRAGFQCVPSQKKMRLNLDYGSEDDTLQQNMKKRKSIGTEEDASDISFSETAAENEMLTEQIVAEFRDFNSETIVIDDVHNVYDEKYNTATSRRICSEAPPATTATNIPASKLNHINSQPKQEIIATDDEAQSRISSSIVHNTTVAQIQAPASRDQWDIFGELVASEFRNLNSNLSRKKLKRRIMQAMLEVGEEDDRAL